MSYPWFFAPDHIPTFSDGSLTYLLAGDGGWSGGYDDQAEGVLVDATLGRRVHALRTLWGLAKHFRTSATEITVGIRFRHESDGAGSTSTDWMIFRNTSWDDMLSLHYAHADGAVEVHRGATVLASVAGVLSPGETGYLEFAVKFDDTAGSYDLRLDGSSIASDTGVNTADAPPPFGMLRLRGWRAATPVARFTDIYVREGLTPYGPITMTPRRPNSDELSAWSRDAGTSNHSRLSEDQTDEGTSYVHAERRGTRDRYGLSASGASGDVVAVVATAVAQGSGAGGVGVGLDLHEGGAVSRRVVRLDKRIAIQDAGPQAGGEYGTYQGAFLTRPGGGAWTLSAADAAELGLSIP